MQHNLTNGLHRWIYCFLFPLFNTVILIGCTENPAIDRFELVNRHNIENLAIDSLGSLSVGNGEFAFTVDITGLQTFPEYYSKGIPLGTMSNWGWEAVLEKQMNYYRTIYERALQTSEHQGYKGVRWPKMVGPDGRESPSTVGTYLIWQQPHFIFFSELLYVNSDNKENVLQKYKDLIFSTADLMASYAWYDTTLDRYVLGPVLIPAQESRTRLLISF